MFNGALMQCPRCHQQSAVCPTVGLGLSVEDLAQIYNLFDIYTQYAICEGFGMPQIEASACGVPVAATDYSAMYDVVRFTKGYPIPVRTFFKEMETNAERAYPDNESLADILTKFFQQSPSERIKQAIEVRKATLKRYDWDKSIQVWENYIDSYQPQELQGKWESPPRITNVPTSIPPNLSHKQFIQWLFTNVMIQPHKIHKEEGLSMYRNLSYGADMKVGHLEPTNQNKIFEQYKNRANNNNLLEAMRTGHHPTQPQQFLIDAHQRQQRVNAT